MPTQLDSRQVVLRAAQSMLGSAANDALSTIFPKIDAEMAKLFEDRNILLTDGGIITFTGTQIQFTENLNIVLNQKISGAAPQIISLGSATVTLANNEMLWAVINRTAGTAALAQGTTMPAVNSTNQEVFLLVKRVDAGDGTQRIYWRTGAAFNAGQSARLGSAGSGSGGSGIGDDLDALLFRASFRDGFDEGPTDTKSAVNVTAGFTDATAYNAAKAMYVLNYDASKTIAAGTTTTNINISAVAAFTVKIGDVVIANNQARKITAVATQASFTTEAFSVAPTLAAQVTVSQAVHTKDIYNFAVDGSALSAAFSGATFQDVLVDFEDTTTPLDNIFDVNVAPVIAFSASADGTTFTDNKTRPTLETDVMQSFLLPAAGTGLTMRFFALKTSGSGSVNVLGYRAFMQKQASAGTAGGIANSAYAFTNGVGTPINSTVSVAGGKTVITLTWAYAVGVYAGTTASSIEVWLNGSKLPRFVNSTLTPDGSFLETSSQVITLDRDYSSQNLSVEVFQRTQIVDNSTTNTSAISYLQEINQNGFQAFVAQNQLMNATTAAGTPVQGSFYSSITGRAAMIDLTQDLQVRMGVNRLMVQSLFIIQNEFGPAGEIVWGAVNDIFGQVRYVGAGWVINPSGTYGPMQINNRVNDYIEVTFFGTGLNLLGDPNGAAKDWRVSVDGAAEGANIVPNASTTSDAVTGSRNTSPNQVVIAASGLSLGVHTVKIRSNSVQNLNVNGFEVVNDAAALRVNPGVSYINGQKLVLSAAASPSYNSAFDTGTLGTRGGHVVMYQKSDGTIGKAVTPTGSQLNLAAADHSQEEVARTYMAREFNAGRPDDFNGNFSNANKAFTLDDNVTTLGGQNISFDNNSVQIEHVYGATAGSYLYIVFVGTGLDIYLAGTSAGTIDPTSVSIDNGASIGTYSMTTVDRYVKIVSGLPYGTHVVRFSRAATAGAGSFLSKLIVYQPKKPAIPTGAVELADYNILGNFTQNATIANDAISGGVIRHQPLREIVYRGTASNWNIAPSSTTADNTSYAGGFLAYVNAGVGTGAIIEYTFFGTGIELRGQTFTGNSANITVTVDGATVPNGQSSAYGWSYAGGVLNQAAGGTGGTTGAGVSFTGLTLGMHTIRLTNNVSGQITLSSMDVITPIHSAKQNILIDAQNTLPVGSQTIGDSRKLTPLKDQPSQVKASAKAIGISVSPTTTSTTYVPCPDLSTTLRSANGGRVKIGATINWRSSATNGYGFFIIVLNGVQITADLGAQTYVATADNIAYINETAVVGPGVHKVDVYWRTASGTLTAQSIGRSLTVDEI